MMRHWITRWFSPWLLILGTSAAANGADLECQLTPKTLKTYQQVEARFPDRFKVDNPDDPRQVAVEGIFVSPSGGTWHMPGFFYQDFQRQGDKIVPVAQPEWRVRFTPTEAGRWTARVEAHVGGKLLRSDAGSFHVEPRQARGFLHRANANPLALEFDNGEPLLAIGSNVFPETDVRRPVATERAGTVIRQLERTAKAGGTFGRLRMDSWFLPIELPANPASGYPGVGRYHAQSCWEIDRIVEAAERLHITLMLCLSNANAHVNASSKERIRYDLYLKENGGFLDSKEQFWTHPEVRRLFMQNIRYCVARWGASPAIGAWEFFNEVVLKPETAAAIVAWHRDLAAAWHRLDPYRRPITTSPMRYRGDDAFWSMFDAPEIDLIQYHTYDFTDLAEGLATWNRQILRHTQKPLVIGEFGTLKSLRESAAAQGDADAALDPEGLHIHNALWASAMSGAVGALAWPIESYIDRHDLYHVYSGLSRFSADWKINSGPWRTVAATIVADADKLGAKRWGPLELPTVQEFARAPSEVYQVDRDGTVRGGAINGLLFGPGAHKDLRRPPTFEVDYPAAGKFIVGVRFVVSKAGSEAPLLIQLDGKEVACKIFAVGEGSGKKAVYIPQFDNWNVTYDREVTIDVPAGRHRIFVDTLATDRMAVGYTLTPYADRCATVYRVLALGSGSEVRLWVQNSANTYANRFHGKGPTDSPPAQLRVSVPKAGRYDVQWWDTVQGVPTRQETVEAHLAYLQLALSGTLSDEACRIRKLP